MGDAAGGDGVRLSTLDRIKGLEFSAVAIVGMGERDRRRSEPQADEEIRERNRLFVGMTRAKNELYVSYHGTPSGFLGVDP